MQSKMTISGLVTPKIWFKVKMPNFFSKFKQRTKKSHISNCQITMNLEFSHLICYSFRYLCTKNQDGVFSIALLMRFSNLSIFLHFLVNLEHQRDNLQQFLMRCGKIMYLRHSQIKGTKNIYRLKQLPLFHV